MYLGLSWFVFMSSIVFPFFNTVLSKLKIQNFRVEKNKMIIHNGIKIDSSKVWSVIECAGNCVDVAECCAASYDYGTQLCTLVSSCCQDTKQSEVSSVITKFDGQDNTTSPKDCSEIPRGSPNGIYRIYPGESFGLDVYCYECWTVIQRRIDGSTNFDRLWQDYKTGFGNLNNEYWIGNDNIHILTSSKDYQLRFQLIDFNNVTVNAIYTTFRVGNESSLYRLEINGYSGTAGDAMLNRDEQVFSTKDQDNDDASMNCAKSRQSGWWFSHCSQANPNGKIIQNANSSNTMYWRPWHEYESLKSCVMMIKR